MITTLSVSTPPHPSVASEDQDDCCVRHLPAFSWFYYSIKYVCDEKLAIDMMFNWCLLDFRLQRKGCNKTEIKIHIRDLTSVTRM